MNERMNKPESETASVPSVEEWESDPDAATPPCPLCGAPLGIHLAALYGTKRDVWVCADHGVVS